MPCHQLFTRAEPATAAQIAALEQALGATLPADFRAHLLRYGGGERVPFYEYDGLNVDAILSRWQGLEELRESGTFAKAKPHELSQGPREVQFQWWHRGWVPFAEDGGGNLYCVDLDPDLNGRRGQVIAWEMHSGPVGPYAGSFADFLGKYVERLESGDYRGEGTSIVRD